jgi:signal transduction histidine kinase
MKQIQTFYTRSSVAVKLLLPLLTAFLSLWTVGTLGVAYFARQHLEETATQDVEEMSAAVLRSLKQNREILRSQARWVADQSALASALENRDAAKLQRLLLPIQASLKLDLIKVVDPQGQAIAMLQQDTLNQAELDDQKTRRAAGIGFELFAVIHAQGDAPSSLVGVTAIKSQQQVLGGILVGNALNDTRLAELRSDSDKQLVILRNQQVVATTLPEAKTTDWGQLKLSAPAQFVTIAHQSYLAKSVSLTGDNEAVIQIVVLKSAQSLQQAEQNLGLLVGGFGVIGTGIVAIVATVSNRLTGRLTQQLRDLTAATQQVADRNFRDLISVQSQDEIGQLSQSFNQMALQLLAQDDQLQQQMQTLENTLKQLKQTQAQLIQSEKMSSLGQLVAGIAHEVNNPINFIHGNISHAEQYFQEVLSLLDLYQEHYPNPEITIQDRLEAIDLEFLRADLLKMLESMQTGTKRVQDIVLSLRTFSRLDESALKFIDLHQSLESTLLVLHSRLGHRLSRAEIAIERDYVELPKIECYAGQLNQVLLNLLSNAIDAVETTAAPRITIRTYVVDQEWIGIAIADNGTGIDPEIQPKLFDPFFTTKPVGKGTGLGLSTSYQVIVQQHQGKLSCTSVPGTGATFTIEIPTRHNL